MAEPWCRQGEWMTWGKMARKALQACAQKCRLILHFDSLPSSPLFRLLFLCLLPTVLVTELCEKTVCARCQRAFVRWMKSLLPLPPLPSHFRLNPVPMPERHGEQKDLTHRGLYAAGAPACGRVADVAACQLAGALRTHRKLCLLGKNVHKAGLFLHFSCQNPKDERLTPVSAGRERFSRACSQIPISSFSTSHTAASSAP